MQHIRLHQLLLLHLPALCLPSRALLQNPVPLLYGVVSVTVIPPCTLCISRRFTPSCAFFVGKHRPQSGFSWVVCASAGGKYGHRMFELLAGGDERGVIVVYTLLLVEPIICVCFLVVAMR
ncbi:hypothetical protein BDW22DRAFT_1360572 [Trametopsis cervina]|nr:hypothetical protein BDW22DRAFT_1360572 [Trametopsis cervina]